MKIPLSQAKEFMNRFHLKYPKSSQFLKDTVANCRETGYIKTLLGRRRVLGKLTPKKEQENGKEREGKEREQFDIELTPANERQAVNSVCQGSAADLVKIAMSKVHKAFGIYEKGKRELNGTYGNGNMGLGFTGIMRSHAMLRGFGIRNNAFEKPCARLVLQIHDELLFEVRNDVVKDIVVEFLFVSFCLFVVLRDVWKIENCCFEYGELFIVECTFESECESWEILGRVGGI